MLVLARALPLFASASLTASLLAVTSCGGDGSRGIGSGDGGSGTPTQEALGDGGFITNNADGGGNSDGCSEEAKLVYVLSLEGDIYSFAPADKVFTKLAPLKCKSPEGISLVPVSMAVDRSAVAWVNMRDPNQVELDRLYKVNTKTGACTPPKVQAGMGGMGLSLNAGSKDQETLFVVSEGKTPGAPGVSRVDVAKETITPINDMPNPFDLELTGTGDGKLFALLIDTPLAVAEMNKTSLAFTGRFNLPQVEEPLAPMFAFSFWGGDFYIYTATSTAPTQTTNVTRYRPSDKSVNTAYMRSIGFHIVGAGVSTCAPTTSPK